MEGGVVRTAARRTGKTIAAITAAVILLGSAVYQYTDMTSTEEAR